MACGAPAVASKVGSVPEIMASEPNLGVAYDSENVQQIVDALEQMLTIEFDGKKVPNCLVSIHGIGVPKKCSMKASIMFKVVKFNLLLDFR